VKVKKGLGILLLSQKSCHIEQSRCLVMSAMLYLTLSVEAEQLHWSLLCIIVLGMGLDIDDQYCNLAKNRLSIELNLLKMGKQNYAEDFTKRVG
jgi:hypothetical protein